MESRSRVKTSRFDLLASLFLIVASLYFGQEVLKPIALAVLFSFLLAPLVRQLQRLRLPRVPAVLLTVLIAFGMLSGIGFVVSNQFAELSRQLPTYRQNITEKLQSMRGSGGLIAEVHKATAEMHNMMATSTGGPTTAPAAAAEPPPVRVVVTNPQGQSSGTNPWSVVGIVYDWVLSPAGTFIIVVVFAIFMLIQKEDLRDRVVRLVGRSRLTVTTQALDDAAERVTRYLVMQTVVNGSVGVLVFLLLWLVGKLNGRPFPEPALWGLLAALLRFIPYVGIWASSLTPIALSLAVYSSARVAFETFGVYLLVEGTVSNAVEPLLFGSSTGIATLAVLVAAAFWAWLWGPVGLLLSTPLTVCLVVLGKYVPQLTFLSILLGDEPALSPPTRVYERLLALNTEAAAELTHEFSRDKPLEQVFDEMLLPALVMAEDDRARGNLEPDRHRSIVAGIRGIVEELVDAQSRRDEKQRAEALVHAARGGDGPKLAPLTSAKDSAVPAGHHGTGFHLPTGCTVTVACLAAHDDADEVAAVMLSRLLELQSYCVILGPAESLASELAARIESAKPDVIFISSVPPSATLHARHLLKRLSAHVNGLPVVVGLWNSTVSMENARERLGGESTVQAITTLHDALRQIHQLAQPSVTRMMTEQV